MRCEGAIVCYSPRQNEALLEEGNAMNQPTVIRHDFGGRPQPPKRDKRFEDFRWAVRRAAGRTFRAVAKLIGYGITSISVLFLLWLCAEAVYTSNRQERVVGHGTYSCVVRPGTAEVVEDDHEVNLYAAANLDVRCSDGVARSLWELHPKIGTRINGPTRFVCRYNMVWLPSFFFGYGYLLGWPDDVVERDYGSESCEVR